MDAICKTHLNAGVKGGGGVQAAQCVTLSLQEPHTAPSEAYLPCQCAAFSVFQWSSLCVSVAAYLCLAERKQHSGMQYDEQQLAAICLAGGCRTNKPLIET